MDHQPAIDTTVVQQRDFPTLTQNHPILVSDDDAMILTLIKYMLERRNLSVVAALDPRDTIRICQAAPVSLVISDVMKPGMNGIEMLAHLRTDPVTASLPVMFLTTCCPGLIPEKLAREIDGFMLKPFYHDALLAMVYELLRTRGRWEQPAGFDPQVFAALTDSIHQFARGDWHRKVWTTRKHQLN